MKNKINRRTAIKITTAAALATTAGGLTTASAAKARKSRNIKSVLRLAHITDIHVQPERDAAKWLTTCLHHIQSQKNPPKLILNGGDCIMDSLGADEARTRVQWELFQHVLKQECSLPIEHCIGNHDVWGWDREKSPATGKEPLYGKKWAMEVMGLSSRFRSFDQGGWHFIVLDSTHSHESATYTAKLDEEQFAWLASDLAATKPGTPVLILSHIPILAACAYFDGDNEESGNWHVPGAWMHIDARRIKDLFLKHPNVKLCLSGHIHLKDRVDYEGVTYLCNGAVCGRWWKGSYQECPPGYALIDLYEDGSFNHQYVTYGWQPKN